jgi:hypothetical protein
VKSDAVIALTSPCSSLSDGDGATAASAARNTTRPFPKACGRHSHADTTREEKTMPTTRDARDEERAAGAPAGGGES